MATSFEPVGTIHDDDHQSNYDYASFGGFKVYGRRVSAGSGDRESKFSTPRGRYDGSAPKTSPNVEPPRKWWKSQDNRTVVGWVGSSQLNSMFGRLKPNLPNFASLDPAFPQVNDFEGATSESDMDTYYGMDYWLWTGTGFRINDGGGVTRSVYDNKVWVNKKQYTCPSGGEVLAACLVKDAGGDKWIKALYCEFVTGAPPLPDVADNSVICVLNVWYRKLRLQTPNSPIYGVEEIVHSAAYQIQYGGVPDNGNKKYPQCQFNRSGSRVAISFPDQGTPGSRSAAAPAVYGYLDTSGFPNSTPTFTPWDLVDLAGGSISETGSLNTYYGLLKVGYVGDSVACIRVYLQRSSTGGTVSDTGDYPNRIVNTAFTNVTTVRYELKVGSTVTQLHTFTYTRESAQQYRFAGPTFVILQNSSASRSAYTASYPCYASFEDEVVVWVTFSVGAATSDNVVTFNGLSFPLGPWEVSTNLDLPASSNYVAHIKFKGQDHTLNLDDYFTGYYEEVGGDGVPVKYDGFLFQRELTASGVTFATSDPNVTPVSIPDNNHEPLQTSSTDSVFYAAFYDLGFSYAASVPNDTIFCAFNGNIRPDASVGALNVRNLVLVKEGSTLRTQSIPGSALYNRFHLTTK